MTIHDSKLIGLRQLVGRHNKVLYEAVKAGRLADVPAEDQALARAMSEHMHLRHVHNALEFADLRQGERYEIEVEGKAVSPMAHVVMHSAVKGQVEADPRVRAAFEKLVATAGIPQQLYCLHTAVYWVQFTQSTHPSRSCCIHSLSPIKALRRGEPSRGRF